MTKINGLRDEGWYYRPGAIVMAFLFMVKTIASYPLFLAAQMRGRGFSRIRGSYCDRLEIALGNRENSKRKNVVADHISYYYNSSSRLCGVPPAQVLEGLHLRTSSCF